MIVLTIVEDDMSTIKAKDHVAELTNTSPNDWKE